jgi:hypothetical protein
MKTILTALFLATTQPAFAAAPANQQILASVNQLETDAKNFALMIGDGQDCSLSIKKFSDGIRITMMSAAGGAASLDVNYDNAVGLTKEFSSDGSYSKEYEIPGQGKLTAINADDSYFHASLEANGKKVSCELDF